MFLFEILQYIVYLVVNVFLNLGGIGKVVYKWWGIIYNVLLIILGIFLSSYRDNKGKLIFLFQNFLVIFRIQVRNRFFQILQVML